MSKGGYHQVKEKMETAVWFLLMKAVFLNKSFTKTMSEKKNGEEGGDEFTGVLKQGCNLESVQGKKGQRVLERRSRLMFAVRAMRYFHRSLSKKKKGGKKNGGEHKNWFIRR